MTSEIEDKAYSISEASKLTGVQPHLMRQWEKQFSQLRPRRSSTGNRLYEKRDIEIIKRIKTLMRHEGMTLKGARTQLTKELREVGHPKNRQEMLDMLDKIADEARAIIGLYDPENAE